MKIDYENCRVYFTKEEVSIFNLKKYVGIHGKFLNPSEARPNITIAQLGKCTVYGKITEEISINIEGDDIIIDSVYYVESFQFTIALIGNAINEVSLVKGTLDKVPTLNIPPRVKSTEVTIDKDNKQILTLFKAYNYRRKSYGNSIGYVFESDISKNSYPIYHIKSITHPIRLGNQIDFIQDKKLKENPLFIGYYTYGNNTIDRVGNIRLLSIHKWREYFWEGNKSLLTDPTINPTKVFSKMFDSYSDICDSLNKIKDLEVTPITEVKGDKIIDYYYENNYLEKTGSLGGSCMRYKDCQSRTRFYAEHNNCSLAIMLVADKIAGRAIIWDCIDGSRVMDRIYTCYERHEKLFIDYCKANNIQFIYDFKNRIKSNSTGYGPSNFDGSFTKKFKIQLDSKVLAKTDIRHCDIWRSTSGRGFPYFDNFFYVDIHNKYLANYESYKDEPNLKYSHSSSQYDLIDNLKEFDNKWYDKNSFVTTNKGIEMPQHKAYRIDNVWYDKLEICTPWNYNSGYLRSECIYQQNSGSYIRKVDLEVYNKHRIRLGYKPIDDQGREIYNQPTIVTDYRPINSGSIFSVTQDNEESRPF